MAPLSDSVPPMNDEPTRGPAPTFVWVAVLMGLAVLATQAILLFVLLDTRSDVSSAREDIADVELRLAGGVPAAPETGTPPTTAATVASPTSAAPPATDAAPPATTAPPGTGPNPLADLPSSPAPELSSDAPGLPFFEDNESADPAVGQLLGELAGNEWEIGQELAVALDDGTARAIVVWAHWCPSCQELLPQLAEWQTSTEASLENSELITIASAAEQDTDNPLTDYLTEQDFPFPVILDSSNELAARLGVNAFPFWVFVSPDGQVIGRLVGQLPPDQFASLLADLDEIGAGGS